jgi:hypothetical protein
MPALLYACPPVNPPSPPVGVCRGFTRLGLKGIGGGVSAPGTAFPPPERSETMTASYFGPTIFGL